MNTLVSIAVVGLMLTGPQEKAGLTGKWEGETKGGSSVVLDLTVKGTTLTGTFTRNGQSTPITDGKVSTDSFTFKATVNGTEEALSGTRAEEDLRVWLDRQGPSTAIVLKRVKPVPPRS